MLRHTGDKRSYTHNIRLAILLSANAGFINTAGFIAFSVLTTNITGHAALLAAYTAEGNLRAARMVALWLIVFLLGSFASSIYISLTGSNKSSAYPVPILVISAILASVAMFGGSYDHSLRQTELFAGSLLFGMGMQNALVSIISGFMVRTTHLTGTVTDLGIDLATLATSKNRANHGIKRRINMRLSVIFSFLGGGLVGGLVFSEIRFMAFYIPVAILLVALFYDYFRVKITRALRSGQTR